MITLVRFYHGNVFLLAAKGDPRTSSQKARLAFAILTQGILLSELGPFLCSPRNFALLLAMVFLTDVVLLASVNDLLPPRLRRLERGLVAQSMCVEVVRNWAALNLISLVVCIAVLVFGGSFGVLSGVVILVGVADYGLNWAFFFSEGRS